MSQQFLGPPPLPKAFDQQLYRSSRVITRNVATPQKNGSCGAFKWVDMDVYDCVAMVIDTSNITHVMHCKPPSASFNVCHNSVVFQEPKKRTDSVGNLEFPNCHPIIVNRSFLIVDRILISSRDGEFSVGLVTIPRVQAITMKITIPIATALIN
nr:hypothetical protein Iba_chr10cCG10530 [Ipomoea batatas]